MGGRKGDGKDTAWSKFASARRQEPRPVDSRSPGKADWLVGWDLNTHSLPSMVVSGENFEHSGRRADSRQFAGGEADAERAASCVAYGKLAVCGGAVEEAWGGRSP